MVAYEPEGTVSFRFERSWVLGSIGKLSLLTWRPGVIVHRLCATCIWKRPDHPRAGVECRLRRRGQRNLIPLTRRQPSHLFVNPRSRPRSYSVRSTTCTGSFIDGNHRRVGLYFSFVRSARLYPHGLAPATPSAPLQCSTVASGRHRVGHYGLHPAGVCALLAP